MPRLQRNRLGLVPAAPHIVTVNGENPVLPTYGVTNETMSGLEE